MPRGWARAALSTAGAIARRPSLWLVAARQAGVLLRPGFRPYLGFRLTTAYGDAGRPPDPHDVVTWLGWCRTYPRAGR